jgi:hypothetical protein
MLFGFLGGMVPGLFHPSLPIFPSKKSTAVTAQTSTLYSPEEKYLFTLNRAKEPTSEMVRRLFAFGLTAKLSPKA